MNDESIEFGPDHVDDEVLPSPRPGRRLSRRTTLIAVGAAGLMVVGGGVALASTTSGTSTAAPGYGPGHQGERPSGAPSGSDQGSPAARTPHLMGTVKSVSGSTILITDQDGFTRTIKVSSSTKYTDSLTANPAVGTKIAAEGTVDSDGTSLDATTVGTVKMADGQGGPGGGRPGGKGPGGARPSGAPSSGSSGSTSKPTS
jgi:hypothetical protein